MSKENNQSKLSLVAKLKLQVIGDKEEISRVYHFISEGCMLNM